MPGKCHKCWCWWCAIVSAQCICILVWCGITSSQLCSAKVHSINEICFISRSLATFFLWSQGWKVCYGSIYSQERRRERYQIIFIWKISQGLVSGYKIPFSVNSRTGRWAVPAQLSTQATPASVKAAKESSLRVRGCQLFNLLPASLRNSNHGDILMFKNNLDHYLSCVPDQPTTPGLVRHAQTNSLLHQVPLMGGWTWVFIISK